MLDMKTDRYASKVVFEESERKSAESIQKKMGGRISSKTFGLLTVVGVLISFFGFIPFIISSAKFSTSSCVVAVIISLFACSCVAVASFIALKVQRRSLKKLIDDYNDKMTENIQVIQNGAQIQSQYLSALLNYMEKYQMLISGRVEEHHLKQLEDLTNVNAMYQDAIDQCKSIASLCHVKLKGEDPTEESDRIFFSEGAKIYLHEDTDMLNIPLNSTQNRLVPPFPFVTALYLDEEKIYESSKYYSSISHGNILEKTNKGGI